MKNRRDVRKDARVASADALPKAHTAEAPRRAAWAYALAALGIVVAAFCAYAPALHGPFLFDDNFLPFAIGSFAAVPLKAWMQGSRPALMFSYWVNAQISGDDTWSYHVVNVALHCITTGLVFLMVRRVLGWSRSNESRRDLLAGFAAGVFLLHPMQTEAVAYLAGRSEALSVMLVFTAFTVFLYRREVAASWAASAGILVLAGVAILAKEHAVALLPLLLLTDYWWNPGFSLEGIRRNWKLYVPVTLGGAAGVFLLWRVITTSTTAGFGLKDFTWYQYFFTQCRALFVYLGEFLLPVGLNADWDFPISKTLLDRGAVFGLVALVALAGAAWHFRRRFPLATYGFFAFLVLMAPTSSILPIRDPLAERRIYLAMPGLLLILVDVLGRWKVDRKALRWVCAAVLVAAGCATYVRAAVWSDQLVFWQDIVAKSPAKLRGHQYLAFTYYQMGQSELAIPEFEKTARLQRAPDADLLLNWGLAYDALNRPEDALAKLRQSAALKPTAQVYTQIAMVHAKRAQWPAALDALATAEKLDPGFPDTYSYRGKIYFSTNQFQAAVEQYQRALAIDPTMQDARHDLNIALGRLRAGR